MDLSLHVNVSGLNSATKRIAASAENIANSESTRQIVEGKVISEPYVPKHAVDTSLQGGGVTTSLRPLVPAAVGMFDPGNMDADENGVVQKPNVDFVNERVNQIMAENAYKANLNAINTKQQMFQNLVNILG